MKNYALKKIIPSFITAVLLTFHGMQVFAETPTYDFEEIDSYLETELEKANVPGASIVIVDKDNVLFERTYGNCDSVERSFVIGSLSKSITAMAIMQLVDEGKVNLDNPISAYLPTANEGERITVKQLLNQTSGLSMYASQNDYTIGTQGRYEYSGANYGLLGQIVEAVSGTKYTDYIQTNIFDPIGMSSSYTSLDEAAGNGLIDGYRNYFGFTIKEKMAPPAPDTKAWLSVPAGYLISSASDIGKYLQVYLNDGADILSPDSAQAMFYNNFDQGNNYYYGMGWQLNNNFDEPIIMHDGDVENYMTYMAILPESGVGVAIMTNTSDYLVANSMIYNISTSIPLLLLGEKPNVYDKSHYWKQHLFYDFICLAVILLALLPLLRIKKWLAWKKKSKRQKLVTVLAIAVHAVLPTIVLLLPAILRYPMSVISGFVPDLYLVLLFTAFALYAGGVVKIVKCFQMRKQ